MRAQASLLYIIVLDFLIFALFLNHSARNASGVENGYRWGRVDFDVYKRQRNRLAEKACLQSDLLMRWVGRKYGEAGEGL